MVKRKQHEKGNKSVHGGGVHSLTVSEIEDLRRSLLQWYDENQRELPWRTKARTEKDVNKRAYAVWVSEVMLQQTQVATVINYYNKWMEKWPTLQSLAQATLEEVHEVWSGLGYYSRGQRLHQGACKVVHELAGEMPRTAEDLLDKLPGVGRYTAGAIASIALSQCSGVVDGNVSRVFSRLRVIGAEISSNPVTDHLWQLANDTVDEERPGDYNQALMELGATVCTPKTPQCNHCPVSELCLATKQVEKHQHESAAKLIKSNNNDKISKSNLICEIEDCFLCLPGDETYEESDGVLNYPRKAKKKAPREEKTAVCLLRRPREGSTELEYLVIQRPDRGLLANLWEFPSIIMEQTSTSEDVTRFVDQFLDDQFNFSTKANTRKYITDVLHIFSHIRQTYMVEAMTLTSDLSHQFTCDRATKWVTNAELQDLAISTAMKKVFKTLNNDSSSKKNKSTPVKCSSKDGKKQLGLEAFFKKK